MRGRCGIITNSHDTGGSQQPNKVVQQLFACSPLLRIVLPIGEWTSTLVRMKWKDVPKKNLGFNLIQLAPYNCSGTLSNSSTYSGPLSDKIPTLSMVANVDIIRQREPCTTPPPISKIAANPKRVNRLSYSASKHG